MSTICHKNYNIIRFEFQNSTLHSKVSIHPRRIQSRSISKTRNRTMERGGIRINEKTGAWNYTAPPAAVVHSLFYFLHKLWIIFLVSRSSTANFRDDRAARLSLNLDEFPRSPFRSPRIFNFFFRFHPAPSFSYYFRNGFSLPRFNPPPPSISYSTTSEASS